MVVVVCMCDVCMYVHRTKGLLVKVSCRAKVSADEAPDNDKKHAANKLPGAGHTYRRTATAACSHSLPPPPYQQLTECDCSPVHVDPVWLQPQQLLIDQVHHTEGLVDLPVVYGGLGQASTRQGLGGGSSGG